MKINEFVEKVNENVSKFGLVMNYNPVDGAEIKSNYKFLTIAYDVKYNTFSIETKQTHITNSFTIMKYMQEIAQAGEVLEILDQLALKYGTMILFL